MTLLYVFIALIVGVIVGAVARATIVNELHKVGDEIHDRIARLEKAVREKL